MLKMRNSELLKEFVGGSYKEIKNTSDNLYTDGQVLTNYGTVIALRHFDKLIINETKYSSTTSTHQNKLKKLGAEFNMVLFFTDEKTIKELDLMRTINESKYDTMIDNL